MLSKNKCTVLFLIIGHIACFNLHATPWYEKLWRQLTTPTRYTILPAATAAAAFSVAATSIEPHIKNFVWNNQLLSLGAGVGTLFGLAYYSRDTLQGIGGSFLIEKKDDYDFDAIQNHLKQRWIDKEKKLEAIKEKEEFNEKNLEENTKKSTDQKNLLKTKNEQNELLETLKKNQYELAKQKEELEKKKKESELKKEKLEKKIIVENEKEALEPVKVKSTEERLEDITKKIEVENNDIEDLTTKIEKNKAKINDAEKSIKKLEEEIIENSSLFKDLKKIHEMLYLIDEVYEKAKEEIKDIKKNKFQYKKDFIIGSCETLQEKYKLHFENIYKTEINKILKDVYFKSVNDRHIERLNILECVQYAAEEELSKWHFSRKLPEDPLEQIKFLGYSLGTPVNDALKRIIDRPYATDENGEGYLAMKNDVNLVMTKLCELKKEMLEQLPRIVKTQNARIRPWSEMFYRAGIGIGAIGSAYLLGQYLRSLNSTQKTDSVNTLSKNPLIKTLISPQNKTPISSQNPQLLPKKPLIKSPTPSQNPNKKPQLPLNKPVPQNIQPQKNLKPQFPQNKIKSPQSSLPQNSSPQSIFRGPEPEDEE